MVHAMRTYVSSFIMHALDTAQIGVAAKAIEKPISLLSNVMQILPY